MGAELSKFKSNISNGFRAEVYVNLKQDTPIF